MAKQLSVASHVCGYLCLLFAAAMFTCGAMDLGFGGSGLLGFVASGLVAATLGFALYLSASPPFSEVSARGVVLSVCLGWTAACLLSTLPFVLILDMSFVDALFEATSGLTTTGATVLDGLDEMDPALLFWRSLLQWLGGIGILAMGLVLLPILGVGGMRISRAESSDVSDLSAGRYKAYSVLMIVAYLVLTGACAVAYAAFGMSSFDAINHAMTTIATGGFSTHDLSFGHWGGDADLLWTATIFMALSSLPFSLYFGFLLAARADRGSLAQAQLFLAIVALLALGAAVSATPPPAPEHPTPRFVDLVFNLVSVISTTGFANADYQYWGGFYVVAILLATFIGGCAGSTSGGVKVYRLMKITAFIDEHLAKLSVPHIVRRAAVDLERNRAATHSIIAFFVSFFALLALATVALAAIGLDPLTAFTGALTALSNVGPGLGTEIGPVGNFAGLPSAAKAIITACMLLGRLELLLVMVVLHPSFWR